MEAHLSRKREEATQRDLLAAQQRRLAKPEDFLFDKSQGLYWDRVTRTLHKADVVDKSIPMSEWRVEPARRAGARETYVPPSRDIGRVEQDQFVESSTWLPGAPEIIEDVLSTPNGLQPMPRARCFNTYQPPPPLAADAHPGVPKPWLRRLAKLFPERREHRMLIDYAAHAVQRPAEKPNFGIVLIGNHGIGKDSLLAPAIDAVGPGNHRTIQQSEIGERFAELGEQVVLVVNEMMPQRDGEKSWHMYDKLKPLLAAPPMVLKTEAKNQKHRYVANLLRVFMMTNYDTALFMDDQDRRLFIMQSQVSPTWYADEGDPDFFKRYWHWLDKEGGRESVRWFLMNRSLTRFNPKGRAPDSPAKDRIVRTWNEPDEAFDAAVQQMNEPDVLLPVRMLMDSFDYREDLERLFRQRMLRQQAARRSGYEVVHPHDRKDARFIGGTERTRYAFVKATLLRTLSPAEIEKRIVQELWAFAALKKERPKATGKAG